MKDDQPLRRGGRYQKRDLRGRFGRPDRAEAPGRGELSVEEQRALQLDGAQDLGEHIHPASFAECGVWDKNAGLPVKFPKPLIASVEVHGNRNAGRKQTMHNMENLKKLPRYGQHAQQATDAFWAYDKLAYADGAIPKKDK